MYQFTSISTANCDSHKDLLAKLNAAGREGYRVIHTANVPDISVSYPESFPIVTFYMERQEDKPAAIR